MIFSLYQFTLDIDILILVIGETKIHIYLILYILDLLFYIIYQNS